MINILTKFILISFLLPFISFGQGYSIPSELYTEKDFDSIERKSDFYGTEKSILSDSILEDTSKTNADILYRMAIILHETGEQNLMICIKMLDMAISQNPSNANYYAVRGIIKYNWGAWSPDYDISEGCSDINNAISLGISTRIRNSETITGILRHPSCK